MNQSNELIDNMKVALADTFAFYLKAHYYHWNVEGVQFVQLHDFFGELYKEAWAAVDDIAEHIRTLDAYAPGSFSRYKELTTIEDDLTVPSSMEMVKALKTDNVKILLTLEKAYKSAEAAGKSGLANFVQDRIDIHEKHGWMLRAITKVK